MQAENISCMLPKFLKSLSNPAISTVFLTGCGGGFDFVHSMCLIPELKRLGKSFIIGSYSFGDPESISGEVIFRSKGVSPVIAKKVSAKSECSERYCPEVAICAYLDLQFPEDSPHFIYAYYARDYSIPLLTELHQKIFSFHNINAVLLIDGGSDSLIKGDEAGFGDPIEDAVSVAAVAFITSPEILFKALVCIGLGADRYNDVSDCSSLRAIAEITKLGGFLGSVALEKESPGYEFYKNCLEHIYSMQSFRSVLSGSILASVEGFFDSEIIQEIMGNRVMDGNVFVWPLMSMLWAFDPVVVADRSDVIKWIKDCETAQECEIVFHRHRNELGKIHQIREVEELPRHLDYSARYCIDPMNARKRREAKKLKKKIKKKTEKFRND